MTSVLALLLRYVWMLDYRRTLVIARTVIAKYRCCFLCRNDFSHLITMILSGQSLTQLYSRSTYVSAAIFHPPNVCCEDHEFTMRSLASSLSRMSRWERVLDDSKERHQLNRTCHGSQDCEWLWSWCYHWVAQSGVRPAWVWSSPVDVWVKLFSSESPNI